MIKTAAQLLKKGSKTLANHLEAFAGESQARNKYTFYAQVARKEGYEMIARILEATADNEKEHALIHLKMADKLHGTLENLRDCAAGELHEVKHMYPRMESEAKAEGENDSALVFRMLAKVEEEHRKRFEKLIALVEQGKVFQRSAKKDWKCSECGLMIASPNAPKACPLCKAPQSKFVPDDEYDYEL